MWNILHIFHFIFKNIKVASHLKSIKLRIKIKAMCGCRCRTIKFSLKRFKFLKYVPYVHQNRFQGRSYCCYCNKGKVLLLEVVFALKLYLNFSYKICKFIIMAKRPILILIFFAISLISIILRLNVKLVLQTNCSF